MDERIRQSEIYKTGLRLVKALQTTGFSAYFVGGAVRDMLLGISPKDIDIATSAVPAEIESVFKRTSQIGACFGVVAVREGEFFFEVATFREDRQYLDGRRPEGVKYTDDPELDAKRRDFTVNGMFFDPVKEELLDFSGGREDLRKGVLRTIGDPLERFSEDYLRMLRAVRFCNRFRFELSDDTKSAIMKLKDKISLLSVERIREELNKMFVGPEPAESLKMLHDLGILDEILPEISRLKNVSQPEKFHPEGDVFEHTLLMFKRMAWPSVDLAWSILLHDVSKADTATVDDEGVEHFYGHEREGEGLARRILEKYKFPRKSIDRICHAVKNHMRFAHVNRMREAKLRRLIAEPDFPLELELHRVDCVSSHNKIDNYLLLLDRFGEIEKEPVLPKPFINGNDLLALGFKPGPEIGGILKEALDMQLEGRIKNKEEALKFASGRL